MRNKHVLHLTQAASIAALYIILTLIANALGLANYAIQVRFSEALTILPYFTGAAVPGLYVGCLLANILTGCAPWDILFGSFATLIGAAGTYYTGRVKKRFPAARWLCPLPPVLANMIIVPQVLMRVYQLDGTLWYFTLTVGIGEVISCYILGMVLLLALEKRKGILSDADSMQ